MSKEILDEELEPYRYSILSYGADYTVDMLVDRIRKGDIYVPPFQRKYVWSFRKACRFIESLLLGLPVPGIFLSREYDTQKLVVIDGQQRLRVLEDFYNGVFRPTSKVFALKSVVPYFENATYKTLKDEDRRRLNDTIIHATIVKQERPVEDDSSIYHIFERLNTGGDLLRPQEIRSAIYRGALNDLIQELNSKESWRSLFGKISKRMRDQELILRFFALYHEKEKYYSPMVKFLNEFMGNNRHLEELSSNELRQVFVSTVDTILKCLGKDAFKPKRALVAAILDSIMVGIARRLERGQINDCSSLMKRHNELMNNELYIKSTTEHTTDEKTVQDRIELATESFADVE